MNRQIKLALTLLIGAMLVTVSPRAAELTAKMPQLKEKTEQLYINYKLLDDLYKDVRKVAGAYIYQSDQQLNYVQKAALYINEARLTSYYQWQMLSVIEYIKPAYLEDYFILRQKDLHKAKKDLNFLITLLDLYSTYIENQAALKPVDEAVAHIKGTIYLFEGLIQMLSAK